MSPERRSEVERLYHAVLDRHAEERAAFLAEACAGDDTLRREVASMLAQARGFLSAPAAALERGTPRDGTSFIGRQVGPYVIQTLLGTGGMGEVYRARDPKLGRDVAIKVLPAIFTADPERLARFEREARVLAALNHPHIGAIYGLENMDGIPALVLELVEGETLAERLARGSGRPASGLTPMDQGQRSSLAVPVEEALGIARQIAEALEAAHERGIVHRDLKPANIKVRPDGIVKVLDFGLAKAIEPSSSPSAEATNSPTLTNPAGITGPGMLIGTAAYMSPEQARGQAVDKRTDNWAFGCVLYETLTGHLAFKGETVSDTIAAVLRGEPEWDALPGGTPAGVRVLLERCLEKDPKRRLRDIGDARIEIEHQLRRAVETEAPANQMWKRATVAAVLALAALAVWKYWPASGAPRVHTIAVLPLQNLSGDPNQDAFSDGTTEALISNLSQIRALDVISRTSVMRYKGTTKTIREIARELPADAFVTGSWQRADGRVRITAQLINASTERNIWARGYERANGDVLKLEDEVAQAIAREINAQITPEESKRLASAKSVNPAAYDEFLLGQYRSWKDGPDDYKEAIAHFQRAIQIDPNYAPAHAALAFAWAGRFGAGYVGVDEAEGPTRAGAIRAMELDPDLAEAHSALAHVAVAFDWDWASAEKSFRRAQELNPDSLATCYCFAYFLIIQGRFPEALDNLEHAAKGSPLSAAVQTAYGVALLYSRKAEDAIPHLLRAKELDPQSADAHTFLAAALNATGKPGEAVKLIHPFGPTGELAAAYAQTGRRAEALKVVAALKDPIQLALAYSALGDARRVVESITKALDQREVNALFVKVDPAYDSLRSDSRFQAQVARLKIPDASR
jgi:serine/threonine protein kinase/Tfp pilus assembly protein PilF